MPELCTPIIRVYRNLTKACWSIQERTPRGWRLVVHATSVLIAPASFVVGEGGWQRVLQTGHKTVHAYVQGQLLAWSPAATSLANGGLPAAMTNADLVHAFYRCANGRPQSHAGYNPQRGPTFVREHSGVVPIIRYVPIHRAGLAYLKPNTSILVVDPE